MKCCKDGRIWGQNNKTAGMHLGILTSSPYIRKGRNPNSIGRPFPKGELHPFFGKKRPDHSKFMTSRFYKSIIRNCAECNKEIRVSGNKRKKRMVCFCSFKCHGLWLRKNVRGKKSYNWKGGISREPYDFNFNNELKELVRKRDNYKCRDCGAPQEEFENRLPVHHIDGNKKNSDPENLLTLCVYCHNNTHSKTEV